MAKSKPKPPNPKSNITTNVPTAAGAVSTTGFLSTYSVEPAVFLHMLSGVTVFVVLQNFLMEKACQVNLGYGQEVCGNLTSAKERDPSLYIDEEKTLQKLIGTLLMYRTILENIFPLFLVLLIGSWSDKYGRKLPMLIVVLGFIIQNLLLIVSVLVPWIGALSIVLITSIVPGLTGNQASFNSAAFSHVADNTREEDRSWRTSVTHCVLFLSITLAIGVGGWLGSVGIEFLNVFLLGVGAEISVFVYIMIFVENRRDERTMGKSKMQVFRELFNLTNLKEAFRAVGKKREGNTRFKLIMLLVSHFCVLGPMVGELGVIFLFGRYKFNWDSSEMGVFMTYRMILTFLGNFVSMGLLSNKLKLTDPAVGVVACVSGISGAILYTVTDSPRVMFAGPLLALFSSCNMIVPRTILSKLIPHSELGKINSFLACLESLAPLVLAPIYTLVYTHTFEFLPGAFFLVTVGLLLVPMGTYGFFLIDEKKKEKTRQNSKLKTK